MTISDELQAAKANEARERINAEEHAKAAKFYRDKFLAAEEEVRRLLDLRALGFFEPESEVMQRALLILGKMEAEDLANLAMSSGLAECERLRAALGEAKNRPPEGEVSHVLGCDCCDCTLGEP